MQEPSGLNLQVANRLLSRRAYFHSKIAPLLNEYRSFVEFIGEVGGARKNEFLGGAAALLFPIDWAEPFGLVMIEALACGTPVIAWRKGSVPEIIEHGVTGFVVDSINDATACVARLSGIERLQCRRVFEQRFDSRRMAFDYFKLYKRLMAAPLDHARLASPNKYLYEPPSRFPLLTE